MSRIGKMPIALPSGVTVEVDSDFITVNGSKGSLKQFTMPGVSVAIDEGQVLVSRINDEAENRARHGLIGNQRRWLPRASSRNRPQVQPWFFARCYIQSAI